MPKILKIKILIVVILFLEKVSCFCEESHVVICDDLEDIRINETTAWRYVQIGSTGFTPEPAKHIFTSSITFSLSRTKSLTVINQVHIIKTPFSITHESFIETVNFYDNNISEIQDYTFENLPNLKDVYLKNNKIQHLGRALFMNTTLEIVDLSRNEIQTITTCFFESRVKWIVLNHNKIKFFGFEPFPKSLEQLELNHNLLVSLDDTVFSNLGKLKELFIENNRLTKIPDFSFLGEIRFFHLAYNHLNKVDYRFDQHPKLEYLDLNFNFIDKVTIDMFASNGTPPLILLNFNRLTNIVFEHPEKKTDLSLYGNPWNCDCWFRIERTIAQYKHMKTCEFHIFDTGEIPLCIENGPCGTNKKVKKHVKQQFREFTSACHEKIKTCNFRL